MAKAKKKSQVESLVPTRTAPVLSKEFNKASLKKLHYAEEPTAMLGRHPVHRRDKQAVLWNKYIPMTPQKALEILRRGLPEDTEIRINLDEDGTGNITFESEAFSQLDCDFDLRKHKRVDGFANVKEEWRAKGYGRAAIRNQIEFLHACRVNKFSVFAAMTAGGYMWARVGYLPDNVRDDNFDSVRDVVDERYKVLRPLLTRQEKEALDKAVRLMKKKDLWTVADANMDVAKRYRDVFNKAANDNTPKAERAACQKIVDDINDCSAIARELPRWEHFAKKGTPMPLGRALLAGTNWNGHIKLDNAGQMERVGKYVGGWKYIKIEKPGKKP